MDAARKPRILSLVRLRAISCLCVDLVVLKPPINISRSKSGVGGIVVP